MDIQEYIKSGVIESYVLGIADAQDVAELQRLRLVHPEIESAIADCEKWLLETAYQNAVPAAAPIKDKLLASLAEESKKAVVATMPVRRTVSLVYRYVAAASVILFVVSAATNIYLYSKYREAEDNYTASEIKRNSLLVDNQVFQARITAMYRDMAMMSSPSVMKVAMPGIAGKENNLVTLYWNTQTKDVYLIANNLPKAPEGKQYQLWALVDGKPVDAGMLENCDGLCRLKSVQRAQAFAITLEKTGGSPVPTMDQMYVLGNVKS